MKASRAFLFALIAAVSVTVASQGHAADSAAASAPAPAMVTPSAAPELSRFEKCQQDATDLMATRACLADEKILVEQELATAVATAGLKAAETDKTVPGFEIATKLEAANKSFNKYVEDQCAYEMAVYTNGSLAGIANTACITTLTKQRSDLIGTSADAPAAGQNSTP